jgi:hypothetical protein
MKRYNPKHFKIDIGDFGSFADGEKIELYAEPHTVGVKITMHLRLTPERFDELMKKADSVTRSGVEIDYEKENSDAINH